MMVQYMNDLPKLTIELEQLKKHKEELEVSHNISHCIKWIKLSQEKTTEVEAIDNESKVDNIETSSRMFEASLQVSSEITG